MPLLVMFPLTKNAYTHGRASSGGFKNSFSNVPPKSLTIPSTNAVIPVATFIQQFVSAFVATFVETFVERRPYQAEATFTAANQTPPHQSRSPRRANFSAWWSADLWSA
jgi:hypothetical protein